MRIIYTKQIRPLRLSEDDLFSRSGRRVGRVRGRKAYGPDGRYVGTIAGDHLIYRSTDSAKVSSPYASTASAGHASANPAATATWGEEPQISD